MAKRKFVERAYATGAYRKDEKRQGSLNLELDEFVTSVEAEAHILRHTPCTAGTREVASPLANELTLQHQAVSKAIKDARLPRRSRRPHKGLTCSDEVVCPGADPLEALIDAEEAEIDAEEAEKRAALVRKAMKSVVKDGTDKAILRLLYYGADAVTQAQVARKLGISPSNLSKRLSNVRRAILEFIQREGTFS
jgi:RNA polymerase sigma factor (sigma-70 family)